MKAKQSADTSKIYIKPMLLTVCSVLFIYQTFSSIFVFCPLTILQSIRRLIRLINGTLSYDGVPVVTNDEGNGRYHFYTQIPWPGESKLVIELMQSSEAVLELIDKTASFYDRGATIIGKFPSGMDMVCGVVLR